MRKHIVASIILLLLGVFCMFQAYRSAVAANVVQQPVMEEGPLILHESSDEISLVPDIRPETYADMLLVLDKEEARTAQAQDPPLIKEKPIPEPEKYVSEDTKLCETIYQAIKTTGNPVDMESIPKRLTTPKYGELSQYDITVWTHMLQDNPSMDLSEQPQWLQDGLMLAGLYSGQTQ